MTRKGFFLNYGSRVLTYTLQRSSSRKNILRSISFNISVQCLQRHNFIAVRFYNIFCIAQFFFNEFLSVFFSGLLLTLVNVSF